MNKTAEIVAVCISEQTGEKKKNVGKGNLVEEYGLEGDAHAGDWHRQVSLLAVEGINMMRKQGLDVSPGDFAENITTEGIELDSLPVGTNMTIGDDILLEVTQIGKECHSRCAIYYQAGDCIMPKQGIFVRVISGGEINTGDKVTILETSS